MSPQRPPSDHSMTAQPHALSQQRGGSPSTKSARATFAKNTMNNVIPHILQHNKRARLGNASTEPISYSPFVMSIKAGVRSRVDSEGGGGITDDQGGKEKASSVGERSSPSKKGKITGYFKMLPKVKKDDGEFQSSGKDGEAISKQESRKSSDANTDQRDTISSPRKDTLASTTTSPYFSSTPAPTTSSSAPILPSPTTSPPFPKVTVIQSDTLVAAQVFVDTTIKNRRIAVLNMASFLRPGGGVIQGAIAQEESLCLRSTLYTSLDEKFYRLPKFGGLFTEDILVFRDLQNNDLPKSQWYYVDVISVAALKSPDLIKTSDGKEIYEHERDKEEMMSKIKLILLTAQQKKTTHLILGALGCGAYHNPPEEVAKMFRRAIFGDRKGKGALNLQGIEEIVFAIFDDGVNLRVFKEVLLAGGGGGDAVGGTIGDGDGTAGADRGKGAEGRANEDDIEMGGVS